MELLAASNQDIRLKRIIYHTPVSPDTKKSRFCSTPTSQNNPSKTKSRTSPVFSNEISYSSESPIPRSTLLESDHDYSLTSATNIYERHHVYSPADSCQ